MRYFLTVLLLACTFPVFSQYTLETPDRKKVKLDRNGTWKFLPSNDSSLLTYIGYYQKFSLKYDPRMWIKDSSAAYTVDGLWEMAFRSKDAAIVATYTEARTPLDGKTGEESVRAMYEDMGELSILSAKDTTVNGIKLQKVEFELGYSGYDYMYVIYIHSSEKASFQLLVGGYRHVYFDDKKIIDQFINSVRYNK